jgi:hypothetical protein
MAHATLTPPPPTGTRQPVREERWKERVSRSAYFVGAVFLHLIVFVLIATWVIFPAARPPMDDTPTAYMLPSKQVPPSPPPKTPLEPKVDLAADAPATDKSPVITGSGATSLNLPVTPINMIVDARDIGMKHVIKAPETKGIPAARLLQIRLLVERTGRTPQQIADEGADPRNIANAKFPVYLASYADGDWNCNVHLTDGKIDSGSLPDLVAKINEWSHGHIQGEMVPTPLNIASQELLDKKPPFIFFTGHRDFILTDAEIENLRNYLEIGGAIWGDNALAGRGSRFDVAFRREMKRVVPDADKNFEPVQEGDDLLTKWFTFAQLPPGMNYYAEPMEHLDIDGRLAILYTPNDYSDQFFLHILPGDTEVGPEQPDLKTSDPLFTSGVFWNNRNVFFRNFELPSSLAAQHLGMNIIGYFLTRFDKDLTLSTP